MKNIYEGKLEPSIADKIMQVADNLQMSPGVVQAVLREGYRLYLEEIEGAEK